MDLAQVASMLDTQIFPLLIRLEGGLDTEAANLVKAQIDSLGQICLQSLENLMRPDHFDDLKIEKISVYFR